MSKLPSLSQRDKVDIISCGNKHTHILTKHGYVYACGSNYEGQLGLGQSENSA